MEISLLGFALGLLLLAIPLYVVWTVDARRMRRLLVSLGRMALMVGALGGLIHLLMRWNSVPLTLLAGVAVLLASAAITVRHARLGMARLLLPVVVGTLPAVLFVSLYMVFLVLGQRQVFDTRLFIPVLALVIGGIIGLNARRCTLTTWVCSTMRNSTITCWATAEPTARPCATLCGAAFRPPSTRC